MDKKFKALFKNSRINIQVWQHITTNHTLDMTWADGFIQKTEWLQYVGKDDVDGIEIYEGDVFTFEYFENPHKTIKMIGTFVYGEDLGFDIEIYNNDQYLILRYINNGIFKNFKVIGNINETSDIVEKFAENQ